MVFIPQYRSVQEILELIVGAGFDLVVEIAGGRKADFLPGFKLEEGAVIGRSSRLDPVRIPINAICGILRIKGENVVREGSPRLENRTPQYSGDDEVFLDSPVLAAALANNIVQ
jgi:hypothetical protein